jgi:thiamine biosynthesis lipoprotein
LISEYLSRFNTFILINLCLLIFAASCTQQVSSQAEFVLCTVCSVTLYNNKNKQENVYHNVFTRLREIENLMSVNISTSDVSRINAAAGITSVQVHEDVFNVIERAVFFAELSDGAFDPTIGPLVSLWGINSDHPEVPPYEAIRRTVPLINWRLIELDKQTNSVFLKRQFMALDLGAIAKGYAADTAAAIIKNAGIKRAVIDLGGNVVIIGEKKDASPWRIGIQKPNAQRGEYIGIIHVPKEATVVTSGVYERFFELQGIRYHHIFSPSSGYPVYNGLVSVTIITSDSMDADALSTAVFVLGYEKGEMLINNLPDVSAIFIFEDNSVRVTSGIEFTLTDKSFQLKL